MLAHRLSSSNQTLDMRGMRNGTKPFTLARTACTLVKRAERDGVDAFRASASACAANAACRAFGVRQRCSCRSRPPARPDRPCRPSACSRRSAATRNCMVASAPSAGCVPQPVKKKFQPVSGFSAICTEVGQSTTFSCGVDADRLQLLLHHQRRVVHRRVVLVGQQHDRLALVAGLGQVASSPWPGPCWL